MGKIVDFFKTKFAKKEVETVLTPVFNGGCPYGGGCDCDDEQEEYDYCEDCSEYFTCEQINLEDVENADELEDADVCECQVFFAKMHDDVIIPSKRDADGAYDLYAWFPENVKEVYIKPGETVEIKTGLKSAFSSFYRMVLQERGSTGKIGLGVNAGLVDANYRGEWIVLLANDSNKTICISKEYDATTITPNTVFYPYSKAVCQAKLEVVPLVDIVEIPEDKLMMIPSDRGEGKYGSSGK